MKLFRKDFCVLKDYVFILPSIALSFNDLRYSAHTFAIEFRWLVFHARLLWVKEGEQK